MAQIDARSKIHQVLAEQPDMSEDDPEALGHEAIMVMVAEDSTHFKTVQELKRRGN